jgi:hypothetical protein
MNDAGAGEKLKVFISYSRKDSAAFLSTRNSEYHNRNCGARQSEKGQGAKAWGAPQSR